MSRRNWLIVGTAVALVGTAAALVCHDQASRPGEPVLVVLGEPRSMTWAILSDADRDSFSWSQSRNLFLGVGRGEWPVSYHGPGGRKDFTIAGPPRDEAEYFRQELFQLEVPDRLWGRRRAAVTVIASGQVSLDAKEFCLNFYDACGISAGHGLAYDTSIDQQTGILTVRIGWWFPRGEGRTGSLRFRLTPSGLVFLRED